MSLSWRHRLLLQPSLWHFEHWPCIPLDTLPVKSRKAFLRNQQILLQVLQGNKLSTIAQRFNLSTGRISQLLKRVLGGEADTPPVLTRGLVPHKVIKPRTRVAPLPSLSNTNGHACAFKALLEALPELQVNLDGMIEAKLRDSDYAQMVSPWTFHQAFKQGLTDAHWPTDRYPYTTASLAYASTTRYLRERTADFQRQRQQRRDRPARDLGLAPVMLRPFRATQIDEHILDLEDRAHLLLNDQLIPLRLARANVLVAIDVDTHCVLGYHLAPTRWPNQQDLLTLFDNTLYTHALPSLVTPGLSYTPGAAFPCQLENGLPITYGTIHMDNALMHRAQSVVTTVCEHMGAMMSLGLPGQPKVRQLVESVFDYINQHFSHRVASTTGSYPTDPQGESRKNRKKIPTVSFETLNEALAVILTDYNVTPKDELFGASPLALLQHLCESNWVRYVPPVLHQQWQPLVGAETVSLHWYQHEHRRPHINFMYHRYDGPGLWDIAGKAKDIRITFNRRDIRYLQAFTLDGESLGQLVVESAWRRFPHTMATRQWIHKHTKQYRFSKRDPLSSYFQWLLANRGKSSQALSLLRVYTEFTYNQPQALYLGTDEVLHNDVSHPPDNMSPPALAWHPSQANHRE